jgi:hypothetical protein
LFIVLKTIFGFLPLLAHRDFAQHVQNFMDQQHQGYESFNDFGGFVNAFATGNDNYSLNQQQQQPSQPSLLNQEYDARALGNSSLYEVPSQSQQQPSQQYSHSLQFQYHDLGASSSSSLNNKCPPSITENTDNEKSLDVTPMPSQSNNKPTSDTINFDPSQNSMLKALGVVRKDVLGANSKKRRRIVLLNDDEDSDDGNELKNEMKFDKLSNESLQEDNREQRNSEGNEADAESEHEEETENLTDLGALKAKFLLKNAVIIHAKKKKKPRLLDSDDEEQQPVQTTSVDDIGLINENENEEESFENDILIAEPVIRIENPIIADECIEEMHEKPPEGKIEEKSEEKLQIQEEVIEKVEPPAEKKEDTPVVTIIAAVTESNDQSEEKELINIDVLTKASDEQHKGVSNEECEIDPSMSVEAILENIKPMADDDEFFKFDKSDEDKNEDKNLTNEEYFGSPDKSKHG